MTNQTNQPTQSKNPNRKPFIILYLTAFCSMLGLGIIVPFLPAYSKSIGASGYFMVGLIFGSMNLSRILFLPMMLRENESGRRKKKTILAEGLLFYCFLSFAYIWAHDPIVLLVVRFFNGIAASMVLPVSMTIVAELTPTLGEGREMGDFQLASMVGFGLGPLLGGVLDHAFGFYAGFLAMALLNLVAFVLVAGFLPELETFREGPRERKPLFDLKVVLANRVVLGVLIFRFISFVGRGSSFAFIPLLATDPKYMSLELWQIGVIISSIAIVAGGLSPWFGRLADRVSRLSLIIIGSTGFTVTMVAMPHCRGFWSLFAVALASGVFGAIALPASAAISVVQGRAHGMINIMVLFDMAMSLGNFIGPPLGGALGDKYGLETSFYFSGAISLVGTALFWILLKNTSVNRSEKPAVAG